MTKENVDLYFGYNCFREEAIKGEPVVLRGCHFPTFQTVYGAIFYIH